LIDRRSEKGLGIGFSGSQPAGKNITLTRVDQLFGRQALVPAFEGEMFGTRADQKCMVGLFHNIESNSGWVKKITNASNSTRTQVFTFHDSGIKLDFTTFVQKASTSCIERRVTLEHFERGKNHTQSVCTTTPSSHCRLPRITNSKRMGSVQDLGNVPRTTMNQQTNVIRFIEFTIGLARIGEAVAQSLGQVHLRWVH
jgi:hypothetical protein